MCWRAITELSVMHIRTTDAVGSLARQAAIDTTK
jgi:hypothetical protein